MAPRIIFVGGIHGVGKTVFCQNLAPHLDAVHLSASALIRQAGQRETDVQKRVAKVVENQELLALALQEYATLSGLILLDGHFCLIDSDSNIQDIPLTIFENVSPQAVLLLENELGTILERIEKRDQTAYGLTLLTELQLRERNHARFICETLDISLKILNPVDNLHAALEFIQATVFDGEILL